MECVMELPPRPQLMEFRDVFGNTNTNAYYTALGAWERLCKLIIEKEKS